jgi:hypothetical protein
MADLTWMALLREQVAARSITAVALDLGVSRTAVSLVLAGKYTARTDKMAARILDVFSRVRCPYSGGMISPAECGQRSGAMPMGSPGALRWWRMCQNCEHKPTE